MCDTNCALSTMSREELASAAGFFDGEGSTFVQSRAARPRYVRLGVSATQRGDGAVAPELRRLQEALLGMGEIQGPNGDGVYTWRTRGFEDGQAVIALLWRRLGLVKRAGARSALTKVAAQYATGLYVPRRTRARVGTAHSTHARSSAPMAAARTLELAWAAGFLDAEGCFGIVRARSRKRAAPWYRIRASASQHGTPSATPLVLVRLRDVLGTGRIYTHVTTTKNGRLRRYCNACARIRARAMRARAGLPPRQFRNASRRHPA